MSFSEMIGRPSFPYVYRDGKHQWFKSWTHPDGGAISIGENARFVQQNPTTSTPMAPRRVAPLTEASKYPYLPDLGFIATPENIEHYALIRCLAEVAVEENNYFLSHLVRLAAKQFLGFNNIGIEEIDFISSPDGKADFRHLYGDLKEVLSLDVLVDGEVDWGLSGYESRAIRLVLGVSEDCVAEALGISSESVLSWERGKRMKKSEALCYLIAANQVEQGFTPFFLKEDAPEPVLEAGEVQEGLRYLGLTVPLLANLLDIHPASANHFTVDNDRKMVDGNAVLFQFLLDLHDEVPQEPVEVDIEPLEEDIEPVEE